MSPQVVAESKLGVLREAVRSNPDSAKAHMQLGTALISTNNLQEAEAELEKAIEIEPDYAEAWVNLGGLRLSRWDFDGCIEANQKAVACQPEMVQAHYNQGLGYLYLGKSEEMVECFRKVVSKEPNNPGGNYHMAVGLFATGDVSQARVFLNRALSLGYSPQPEFVKAISRERGGSAPTVEIGPTKRDQAQSKEE